MKEISVFPNQQRQMSTDPTSMAEGTLDRHHFTEVYYILGRYEEKSSEA